MITGKEVETILNWMEVVADLVKGRKQAKQMPLHVGEVMNLWTFLTATENFANSEIVALNSVEDKQLREKMEELIEKFHQPAIAEVKKLLLEENVELPKGPTEKPRQKVNEPPAGTMTDEEIANLVMFNLVWAINFCSRGLTESIRQDVGALFAKAIIQKSAFAVTLKQLLIEKGWIKVPPRV